MLYVKVIKGKTPIDSRLHFLVKRFIKFPINSDIDTVAVMMGRMLCSQLILAPLSSAQLRLRSRHLVLLFTHHLT